MIIEFDYDLARDAVECEVGKIITKGGKPVTITDWDYKGIIPTYVLSGFVEGKIYPVRWTREGRYSLNTTTEDDLCLEVGDIFNTEEN